jgi:hypothetical protein
MWFARIVFIASRKRVFLTIKQQRVTLDHSALKKVAQMESVKETAFVQIMKNRVHRVIRCRNQIAVIALMVTIFQTQHKLGKIVTMEIQTPFMINAKPRVNALEFPIRVLPWIALHANIALKEIATLTVLKVVVRPASNAI